MVYPRKISVCCPKYKTCTAFLNRTVVPLSRTNVVPLIEKMWCPGTEMHMVPCLLGAQTRTLAARGACGMSPDQNSGNIPLIGNQTPKRQECGAQEPRLFRSGGNGGSNGAGAQERRVVAGETQNNGYINIRYVA